MGRGIQSAVLSNRTVDTSSTTRTQYVQSERKTGSNAKVFPMTAQRVRSVYCNRVVDVGECGYDSYAREFLISPTGGLYRTR